MQDSMRAVVLVVGTLLLAIAAVMLGQFVSGSSDVSPLASVTVGVIGFCIFVIGLCIPRGVLQKPGGGLDVDAENLGVPVPGSEND